MERRFALPLLLEVLANAAAPAGTHCSQPAGACLTCTSISSLPRSPSFRPARKWPSATHCSRANMPGQVSTCCSSSSAPGRHGQWDISAAGFDLHTHLFASQSLVSSRMTAEAGDEVLCPDNNETIAITLPTPTLTPALTHQQHLPPQRIQRCDEQDRWSWPPYLAAARLCCSSALKAAACQCQVPHRPNCL